MMVIKHAALAVAAHDIGLRRKAVANVSHVANVNGGIVDRLNRQVVQLLDSHPDCCSDRRRIRNARSWRFRTAESDSGCSTAFTTSAGDRPLACSRSGRISIITWRCFPPYGQGIAAPERSRASAYGVRGEVEKLLLAQPFAGKRQLDDRHARSAINQNVGRRGSGRHLLDARLSLGGHLRYGHLDLHVRVEEDLDDAAAVDRLRFAVLQSLTEVVRFRSNPDAMRSSISSAFRPV